MSVYALIYTHFYGILFHNIPTHTIYLTYTFITRFIVALTKEVLTLKLKKALSVCFALLFIFISSFTVVYASTDHQCTYRTWISYEYTDDSESQHKIKQIKNYDCTNTSCLIEYSEVQSISYANHDYSAMKYSGREYHSGSLHYGYYISSCIFCNHQKGIWRSWKCPGGNACILPQMILLSYEVK